MHVLNLHQLLTVPFYQWLVLEDLNESTDFVLLAYPGCYSLPLVVLDFLIFALHFRTELIVHLWLLQAMGAKGLC